MPIVVSLRVHARLLAAVVAVLLLGPVGMEPASGTVDATRDRLAGPDRVGTAAAIARAAFPSGTDTAVLARADAFADAASASGLAGALRAPVLLTASDQLPGVTARTLRDLGVQTVHLLGGDDAVGPAVREALEDAGMDWVRYHGDDRYETAAMVARQVGAVAGLGTLGGHTTVLLASGTAFPDALASSPVAYHGPFPILLTTGSRLPDVTVAMVDELDPAQVVVLGGERAVPSSVAEQLDALGVRVRRVFGPDRTATAAAIADVAVDELGFSAGEVLLARGDAFPDALAAGPYGGERPAAMLLTPTPGRLGSAAADWLSDRCAAIGQVTAIGGRAALAEVALDAAERRVRECGFQWVVPYFVLDGRDDDQPGLVPVARREPDPAAPPLTAALEALLRGPSAVQRAATPAVTTAIPQGTRLRGVEVRDRVATVDLSGEYDEGGGTASMRARLAQVVWTATRFPDVDGVRFELDGEPVEVFSGEGILLDGPQTRAEHTDPLPNLFVDTPPYGGWLGNPARLTGVTSVFEATFAYELRDATGTVVAGGFLTSSDQVLGDFDTRVAYEVDARQRGTLRVFNHSARDGRVENLRVYPVELTPSSPS